MMRKAATPNGAIVFPLTLVDGAVRPFLASITMTHAVLPLTSVDCPTLEVVGLAILHVTPFRFDVT